MESVVHEEAVWGVNDIDDRTMRGIGRTSSRCGLGRASWRPIYRRMHPPVQQSSVRVPLLSMLPVRVRDSPLDANLCPLAHTLPWPRESGAIGVLELRQSRE